MQNAVKKLLTEAKKWTGYLEKKSNKDLNHFTANAGSNNYTCFARDYYRDTGINCQAQPWCAMWVSELFVDAFGLEKAKKLLGGALYQYCPDGVNRFKAVGRWSKAPEPGAVIFFTNGTRAYHTGIVTEVTATKVRTVEGNTSGASGVIENGGGVCQKSYDKGYNRILGYGLPDWSIVETAPSRQEGFLPAADGKRWWYQFADGTYAVGWHWLHETTTGTEAWYLFSTAGYMLTGYQTAPDGREYYLCAKKGVNEGKCMVTDDQGALKFAEYDKLNKRYKI